MGRTDNGQLADGQFRFEWLNRQRQVTDQGDRAAFRGGLIEQPHALGVEEAEVRDAVGSIRSVSAERIHAATQIMEARVNYLLRYDVNAYRKKPSWIAASIKRATLKRETPSSFAIRIFVR